MSGATSPPTVAMPLRSSPDPASRLADLDEALQGGIAPIVMEDGQTRAIVPPGMLRFRGMEEFRYALRSSIAGIPWGEACRRCLEASQGAAEEHKSNLLIWGYKALLAEREAEQDFVEMARDYSAAAETANSLAFALERDSRQHHGIPLAQLQKEKAELYRNDRHGLLHRHAQGGTLRADLGLRPL